MPPQKQLVPDIDFDKFVIKEVPRLFKQGKIFINKQYQRGDIWKYTQKIELIRSIINRYSIGVLVLFKNDKKKFEILYGQQRLLTINQYVGGKLDLEKTDIPKYKDLNFQEKVLLDAYCVYYIQLKSHAPDSKEEDIVQTFLRLQEGTPLNKAEKINAYRGKFKDTFTATREEHPLFNYLGKEKRFRWRQLAAEMLLIELESDFKNMVCPELDLESLKIAIKTYEKDISQNKITYYRGNLDVMHAGLNIILTAFQPREVISFYLLTSYLRHTRADNSNLLNELSEFAREFLKNLNSFSIYATKPPAGMNKKVFTKYLRYKQESKILTTSDSLKNRLEIMIDEFKRIYPFIAKDPIRFHDAEQKRELYFRQKGICPHCNKEMKFGSEVTAHHAIAHAKGGTTSELDTAVLLHDSCHKKLEKALKKENANQIPLGL